MSPSRIVIVANGDLKNPDFYRQLLQPDDYIICADGGAANALAIGLKPDLVIGDLDSLKPDHYKLLEDYQTEIIRYPSEKDQSDLELAIDYALKKSPLEILIIGALGGPRVDHEFVNLLLLDKPLRHHVPARIIDESQEIQLICSEAIIEGHKGDCLSLFSMVAETSGIVTEGLEYPLQKESLPFASSRGLSNRLTSSRAHIAIASGLLMVIKTSC